MRACLVLNSVLNKSVISDVKAVRLCSMFEVGIGLHTRFPSWSFCMASTSGLTCASVGSLVLTVQFMYNL